MFFEVYKFHMSKDSKLYRYVSISVVTLVILLLCLVGFVKDYEETLSPPNLVKFLLTEKLIKLY